MSFEGAISSLGLTRGEDGSIDRSPDPPMVIWNALADVQAKCEAENIAIGEMMQEGGGNRHGLMKREKFCTALKDNLPRLNVSAELLQAITGHYGVGYKDPRGQRENVAWCDFCEDVLKAKTVVDPRVWNDAVVRAAGKGRVPGAPDPVPRPRGWQPGDSTGKSLNRNVGEVVIDDAQVGQDVLDARDIDFSRGGGPAAGRIQWGAGVH